MRRMLELARAAPDGRVQLDVVLPKLFKDEEEAFKQVGSSPSLGDLWDMASRGLKYRKINGSGWWLVLRSEGACPGEIHPCTRLLFPQRVV